MQESCEIRDQIEIEIEIGDADMDIDIRYLISDVISRMRMKMRGG
jgi:hypothetical protein